MSDASAARAPSVGPLRLRIFGAALTSGGAELITRVLGVVISIITARLLEPAEVGILGLAAIIVGLISIIGYYAEIAAVAHGRDESNASMALAALLVRAVVVVLVCGAIAAAFPVVAPRIAGGAAGALELRGVTAVFAITLLFEWLSGYPSVILQRRLDLASIAAIQPMQPIVALITISILLFRGAGPVGVAWGSVAGSASVAILLWVRLLLRQSEAWVWPSRAVWQDTCRGAAAMFIGLFGGFVAERFDNLLVAGTIGPRSMSFYSMAWNASHTPANVFSRAINFVLVPSLAHVKKDAARVERTLRDCLRYSYVLLVPVCALFIIAAPQLVVIVIGAKWLPLVPALRIMSISVLASPMLFACTAVLVGTGRAQWTGIATTIHIIALAILIPPLARYAGVRGAAFGELIAVALLTGTVVTTTRVATAQGKFSTLLAPMLPIMAGVLSGALSWYVFHAVNGLYWRFLGEAVIMGTAYCGLLWVFARDTHVVGLLELLRAMFRRRAVSSGVAPPDLNIVNA